DRPVRHRPGLTPAGAAGAGRTRRPGVRGGPRWECAVTGAAEDGGGMGLDLHKLDHLIAVVEEGGFTRAAARLHMSQQALSASIRSLEREVGVELVDRGGGAVTPRPAAEALVADGRVLRGLARSALLRARRIGRSETEALRVGHTPAVT